MTELDKKINDLKEFIKQKTDQGAANYLGKEIREICGMVETEQCNIDLVSESFDKQELREAYNYGAVNITCHGECMVDSDKDFNDCVDWILKERT